MIYFIVNIVQIILNLTLLGVKTFLKIVSKDFLLKINVCIVKGVSNGLTANVSVYQTRVLLKYVKMIYLFFCEDCDLNISVCYRCNLVCKDSEICLTCFLCYKK